MKRRFPQETWTLLLLLLTLFSHWTLANVYHRHTSDAGLWVSAILGVASLFIIAYWSQRRLRESTLGLVGRAASVAMFGIVIYVIVLSRATAVRYAIGSWFWVALALLGAAMLWMTLRLSPALWRRTQNAALSGVAIFLLSAPLLGRINVQSITFGAVAPSPVPTVFLLMDEFNAKASKGMVTSLQSRGLNVKFRAVAPVDNATAKVVPAFFLGRPFPNAVACGWSTICSDHESLDFSRITMQRPDVDIVGFFHPYCHIQGLRYCHVEPTPDSVGRWFCRFARSVTNLTGHQIKVCQSIVIDHWHQLADRIDVALWKAPFWQHGGVLYAHVPRPHPPGQHVSEGLARDYRANVITAERFVNEVASRMQMRFGERFRLVISSDHPLRPEIWCQSYLYRQSGCALDRSDTDDTVPVIVASGMPIDPIVITRNDRVFDLIELNRVSK